MGAGATAAMGGGTKMARASIEGPRPAQLDALKTDPAALDGELRMLPGVVETGLFCGRADLVIVASDHGFRVLSRPNGNEASVR